MRSAGRVSISSLQAAAYGALLLSAGLLIWTHDEKGCAISLGYRSIIESVRCSHSVSIPALFALTVALWGMAVVAFWMHATASISSLAMKRLAAAVGACELACMTIATGIHVAEDEALMAFNPASPLRAAMAIRASAYMISNSLHRSTSQWVASVAFACIAIALAIAGAVFEAAALRAAPWFEAHLAGLAGAVECGFLVSTGVVPLLHSLYMAASRDPSPQPGLTLSVASLEELRAQRPHGSLASSLVLPEDRLLILAYSLNTLYLLLFVEPPLKDVVRPLLVGEAQTANADLITVFWGFETTLVDFPPYPPVSFGTYIPSLGYAIFMYAFLAYSGVSWLCDSSGAAAIACARAAAMVAVFFTAAYFNTRVEPEHLLFYGLSRLSWHPLTSLPACVWALKALKRENGLNLHVALRRTMHVVAILFAVLVFAGMLLRLGLDAESVVAYFVWKTPWSRNMALHQWSLVFAGGLSLLVPLGVQVGLSTVGCASESRWGCCLSYAVVLTPSTSGGGSQALPEDTEML